MPIEDISKTSLHPTGTINHVGASQPHTKAEKDKRLAEEKIDSVDISKEARMLEQTVASLKANVHEMPEVRAAKMEEVRTKLADGFYDRPEVIDRVAEKVADAFSVKK